MTIKPEEFITKDSKKEIRTNKDQNCHYNCYGSFYCR